VTPRPHHTIRQTVRSHVNPLDESPPPSHSAKPDPASSARPQPTTTPGVKIGKQVSVSDNSAAPVPNYLLALAAVLSILGVGAAWVQSVIRAYRQRAHMI
jgi:hypothetical protein